MFIQASVPFAPIIIAVVTSQTVIFFRLSVALSNAISIFITNGEKKLGRNMPLFRSLSEPLYCLGIAFPDASADGVIDTESVLC